MLESVTLTNFGPVGKVSWSKMGKLNLLVGANGAGKTFILKALYSAMRTLEEYRKGDDRRHIGEILVDKLHWTFQAERLGDLIARGPSGPTQQLEADFRIGGGRFAYRFGRDTHRQIATVEVPSVGRTANSIFLPAKEVLSLLPIIIHSREQDRVFGFDDTYFDLAKALQILPENRTSKPSAEARKKLVALIHGQMVYDEKNKRWQFRRADRQKFSLSVTAEGVKKIAILDTLLGNRYLTPKSIVFIDEPEAALHPKAISDFLDIVAFLADSDIQFVLSSHSYFVIKKLYLIAKHKKMPVSTLCAQSDGTWLQSDLADGLPDNPIINESVRLYEQEVDLAMP